MKRVGTYELTTGSLFENDVRTLSTTNNLPLPTNLTKLITIK